MFPASSFARPAETLNVRTTVAREVQAARAAAPMGLTREEVREAMMAENSGESRGVVARPAFVEVAVNVNGGQ